MQEMLFCLNGILVIIQYFLILLIFLYKKETLMGDNMLLNNSKIGRKLTIVVKNLYPLVFLFGFNLVTFLHFYLHLLIIWWQCFSISLFLNLIFPIVGAALQVA